MSKCSDNNIMKNIGGNERPICIDTSIDFEVFVAKICYCLIIDWSQSNVHIFTLDDASMDLIEILADDFEYVMVVAKSLQWSIKLYVTKGLIEGKDNQQDEEVHKE